MSEPTLSPSFLYKIVLPDPSLDMASYGMVIPPSPLDAASGFVHLSTADQVPLTASRFFGDQGEIWVFKLPYTGLKGKTKWERVVHDDGGVDNFPHLYRELKAGADISEVVKLKKDVRHMWIFPEGFLEY
ncbi:hypothetical protein BC937DRAFT_91552 [Endogone sp. FLAS-F59071]|nr:hypothetical protein BC937DRAFT_91552 [Endogone sp. FLAS-F59071]|eukprot:RUS16164.1 hypothetical protein BC937DRAFT_91552 [Endogone sp. FLAS-F59071]